MTFDRVVFERGVCDMVVFERVVFEWVAFDRLTENERCLFIKVRVRVRVILFCV